MSIKKKQYWAPKTKMTLENPPFEALFPIQNWYFPMSRYIVFRGVTSNVTDTGFCYKLDRLLLRWN